MIIVPMELHDDDNNPHSILKSLYSYQ